MDKKYYFNDEFHDLVYKCFALSLSQEHINDGWCVVSLSDLGDDQLGYCYYHKPTGQHTKPVWLNQLAIDIDEKVKESFKDISGITPTKSKAELLEEAYEKEDALKPCPFCSGKAMLNDHSGTKAYNVECSKCEVYSKIYADLSIADELNRRMAIRAWNRRVDGYI